MDESEIGLPSQNSTNQKVKGISDFLLILRDRWMISLTLALPIALGFTYKSLQVPEFFASSSSFRLIPPPAIINLQKVDREQQLQPLVSKHLDGLNSQELRAQVVTKIENSPELKTEISAEHLLRQQVVNSLKCLLSLMSWWALLLLRAFLRAMAT